MVLSNLHRNDSLFVAQTTADYSNVALISLCNLPYYKTWSTPVIVSLIIAAFPALDLASRNDKYRN